jgi:hypothetical protein
VLELDPGSQLDTGALQHLYVRSATTGHLVPMSAFTSLLPSCSVY